MSGSKNVNGLTAHEIRDVCRKTIAVFNKYGLDCCLVGSAATTLWGVPRIPNDIDVVVMTTFYTQEGLKRILAEESADYELRPSTNPRNTYKVVWCKVPGQASRKCKVDILVPGIMNIPSVSAHRLVWFRNHTFPSMPLLPLLLLKLQAWDDHRTASYRCLDLRAKQYVDVEDINILLPIAKKHGVHRSDGVNVLPKSFLNDADSRVRSYVLSFPMSKVHWQTIGFLGEQRSTSPSIFYYEDTF